MIRIEAAATNDKFLRKIFIAERATHAALAFAWKEAGVQVTNQLRYLLSNGRRTGRVYTIRGRKHQASAPGEAPASRTGRLVKSVGYAATGHHTLQVGEEADYASYLENGTRKMAPRPHLKVAVDQTQTDVRNTLIQYIAEAYK